MDPFQKNNQSFLLLKQWSEISPNLVAGFTTRQGGRSKTPYNTLNIGLHVLDNYQDVVTNRNTIADLLDFPLHRWAIGEQVHDTNVAVVQQEHTGNGTLEHNKVIGNVDGLITKQPGILCTAFFADCVPLYFFDPNSCWIGIAHAGWRGTVNGMAKKMVNQLIKQGIIVDSLLVAVGPSISKTCYEVDKNVIKHIPKQWKSIVATPTKEDRFLLDLPMLNKLFLLQSGVNKTNIIMTNYCTYKDNTLFFSHRRDKGKTGRMLGFIGYKH